MTEATQEKWHQSLKFMAGAITIFGVFAIPLIWVNRKLTVGRKLTITAGVVVVAVILFFVFRKLASFIDL